MLRQDSLYRGKHAIHVRKHPKLGRHRTILKIALPLISEMLASEEVWRIDLGLISARHGSRRVSIMYGSQQAQISLTICDVRWRQCFVISARSSEAVASVIVIFRKAWYAK